MICFINRSTVDYDIRLQKYVQSCIDTKTPYIVLSWDRTNDCKKKYLNEYQYKALCPYGTGRRHLFAFMGWCFWCLCILIRFRKRYSVIHACNIENALLAFPMKLFRKRIVLDIYDTVNARIEKLFAKKVDLLIIPHELRLEQIGINHCDLKRLLIVENVPIISHKPNVDKKIEFPEVIHLSYVGVFQREIRGIENLIKLVIADTRFILDIAGTGDGMDYELAKNAESCNRIRYYGRVSYSDALEIMSNSDFIVALYYLTAKTHKYASPNKYYESLFLGRPIITTCNTLVGTRVEKGNTGYTIADSLNSLYNFFENINSSLFNQVYIKKKENCTTIWRGTYENYYNIVLKTRYISTIKSL